MNKFLRHFIPYRFWPSTLVRHWIQYKSGGSVISGPFAGMKYVSSAVGSSYEPKVLGTYESELTTQILDMISRNAQIVLDVGAAEGYYAIGMATKCPSCKVIAFEISKEGQNLLAEMAKLNGVQDRVEIHGLCDISSLAQALQNSGNSLLIMDVEGAEKQLLDPNFIPALKNIDILVEIHDYVDAKLGDTILNRFFLSHNVEKISIVERSLDDYPMKIPTILKLFLRGDLLNAICEHRHPNSRWFYMTSRQ